MDKDAILSIKTIESIMDEDDLLAREVMIQEAMDRAEQLKCLTKFKTLINAAKKEEKRLIELAKRDVRAGAKTSNNVTDFTGCDESYDCGAWVANDNGVRTYTVMGERLACYHPIIPVARMINIQTGKEKVKLKFKKGAMWKDIVIDKSIIASSSKIVALADYGVSVTSENSKALVSYLSDVENLNVEEIEVRNSTSKLGWIKDDFVPYDVNVYFDNESNFKMLYESIRKEGKREKWYDLVKGIRATSRLEPKIYMASAFASVLIEPLNALPFIVNLWGDTGKGKTVALMLAASIYAFPGNNEYVTDPKSTITALETRTNFLNNFPVLIDDMSQIKNRFDDDFSTLVYFLCSGKGKERSNVNLGINATNSWKNVFLTNNEHSLVTETMQGGAVNRIIDVEMEEGYIFDNGNHVVEVIKKNYGYAGEEFIELVKDIGFDEISKIQKDFQQRIQDRAKEIGVEKEEKQVLPMSIILTADKLATENLFNDGQYLDFETCFNLLKDKDAVSENQRAYEYMISEIGINKNNFIIQGSNRDDYRQIWGVLENGYAILLKNIFDKICKEANCSSRTFLSWARKKDLIRVGKDGKNTLNKRINGMTQRCIWLKIPDGSNEFVEVEDEQLPFDFDPK
jgi:putative DNA primase/helicase